MCVFGNSGLWYYVPRGLCIIIRSERGEENVLIHLAGICPDNDYVLQNLCNKKLLLLPNKEGSWVLGLQGSVAKILQNPVYGVLTNDPLCSS